MTFAGRGVTRGLLLAAFLSAIGGLAVLLGQRTATSAVVDLGPTDGRFVRNFRDLEVDGAIHFRWALVPSSSVSLPLTFCGPGSVHMRLRRHFLDPAVLTVSVNGRVLGQRSVQSNTDERYKTIGFELPSVTCSAETVVLLETTVNNDRPLGVAVDWIELRTSHGFRPTAEAMARGAVVLAMITLAIGLASGSLPLAAGVGAILALMIGLGFAADPLSADRILRGGTIAVALTLAFGALIAKLSGILQLSKRARTILMGITLATLLSRSMFLHVQAFYPDYRVHALVQQTLNRLGPSQYLDQLFEIQYARSLGLQEIDGKWYPFPYPPGSYALGVGVERSFGLDSLDAATVTAIVAASLIPMLTLALGLSLGLGEFVSLFGAFYVALQPLLVRRLALGYFPGVIGQCVDAVALLLVLRVLRSDDSPVRRVVSLVLALLAAFLIYTQSIANFGLLTAGLVLVSLVRRVPGTGWGAMRVALAAALALSASVGAFYWRYQPVLQNVALRQPQPEAKVLDALTALRQAAPVSVDTALEDDVNDPYAGTTLNPFRGLARLGSRLWLFNGPFTIAIVVAGLFLWRQSKAADQNLLLAWGGVCVWISLLAAGLPSPNGFQHLKDLEFVAPLMALALGVLSKRLWDSRPFLGWTFALAWTIFATRAFWIEFTGRLQTVAGL